MKFYKHLKISRVKNSIKIFLKNIAKKVGKCGENFLLLNLQIVIHGENTPYRNS